ncbi:cytochrome P450 [Streptomonospora sp. PA3]|uniref:cytochrome P450 n=1 Tax=Streptomonospora sp. PA3 TaxID=2607326 RepID=UPI0012DC6152|nr:cytochrome P450 [Streptomonospora sp. PA3]MUL41006.1 cytochrome P450 [Streptomonospora sp. PA3]
MAPRSDGALWDRTAALLRDPYRFVSRRCRRRGTDAFATRLLLQPTVCVTGPQAAAVFQDQSHFSRRGAAPARITKTLFGRGGVQGLDGSAHRHRKRLFISLMAPDRVAELAALTEREFDRAALAWRDRGRVVLYDEFRGMLTRAVCAWAGVPLVTADARRRTAQLTALYDGAGRVGPRHWRSRLARRAADRWAADVVTRIRTGRIKPPEDTAAYAVAWHRDPEGRLLDEHTAAVELLNVLRPTVAVAVFLAFAAHALHHHPHWARAIAAEDGCGADGDPDGRAQAELFAQEVRRFYPFFPLVAARARHDMVLRGQRIGRGRRVLLDLYGIDHDPALWSEPEEFRPERFRGWEWDRYGFVPQGAGDPGLHHRCPGEPIAVALIAAVSRRLARLRYEVPRQDMAVDMKRLPALPRSGCVIRVPSR